jgi:hypothetical protein
MGRKHNDVFVIGPEPLDFEDSGFGDEKKAEPDRETAAREDPSASRPSPGLGHRPLSGRSAGSHGRRRLPLRSAAALGGAAAVAIALARPLSPGEGGGGDRAPTSPATRLAQVAPTIPPAPPAPIHPSRPKGAGPRRAIRRASERPAHRLPRPSEVPPPTVATSPSSPAPVYAKADSFGFER